MSRSARRSLVLLAAVLATGGGVASAGDGDGADAREGPGFWERAIAPEGEAIGRLVDRAAQLAEGDSAKAHARARELLSRALKLDPTAPRPRWELARLYEQQADHAACAEHLRELTRYEPEYKPPHSVHDAPLLVDLKLAECLAASDQLAHAANRLRRILARGITDQARVHAHLAQIEMARGRLDAATYALEQARRLRPHSSRYRFLEAVLHDRAGRPSAARQSLRAALARDPQLRSLRTPAGRFFPPADEHYALGLAYAERGERHRAAIHFRHFVAEAQELAFVERAREHLDAIFRDGLPLELSVTGSASWDEDALRAALAAIRPELLACVADTPGALYRARITTFIGRPQRTAQPGPRPGPRVLVDHAFATSSEAREEAIACAEGILDGVDLPRPRGDTGQYASLEVLLLSP